MLVDDGSVDDGSAASALRANSPVEDESVMTTLVLMLAVFAVCLSLYLCARGWPCVVLPIYHRHTQTGGTRAYPGTLGAVREMQATLVAVEAQKAGFEAAALIRYMRFNLRLQVASGVISGGLIPMFLYGQPTGATLVSGSRELGSGEGSGTVAVANVTQARGLLYSLTISHVANESPYLLAAALSCLAFALFYIDRLGGEWRWYRDGQQQQLMDHGSSEHFAVIATVESTGAPADAAALRVLVGELAQRHSPASMCATDRSQGAYLGERRLLTRSTALDSAMAVASRAHVEGVVALSAQQPTSGCHHAFGARRARTCAPSTSICLWRLWRCTWQVFGPLTRSASTPTVRRFLVVFRRRITTTLSVGTWPSDLSSGAALVRVERAPRASDADWKFLLAPRWRRSLAFVVGWILTLALFAFWGVPVAAVQFILSLDALERLPALRPTVRVVRRLEPDLVRRLEGLLSTAVLQLARALTLNFGLFHGLVRLRGSRAHSTVTSRSASHIFAFSFVWILNASLLTGSLLQTLQEIVQSPLELPQRLALQLPALSSFFFQLVLWSIGITAVMDVLQIMRLLSIAAVRAMGACRCACGWLCGAMAGGCGAARHTRRGSDVEGQQQPSKRSQHHQQAAYRRQLISFYSRAVLSASVHHLFMSIAPIAPFFALLHFALALPVTAHALHHIYGPPDTDTAGAIWREAVRYQTYALLMGQMVLVGVTALKGGVAAPTIVALAFALTLVRTQQMRQQFVQQTKSGLLTLQRAAQLDARDACGELGPLQPLEEYQRAMEGAATERAGGRAGGCECWRRCCCSEIPPKDARSQPPNSSTVAATAPHDEHAMLVTADVSGARASVDGANPPWWVLTPPATLGVRSNACSAHSHLPMRSSEPKPPPSTSTARPYALGHTLIHV